MGDSGPLGWRVTVRCSLATGKPVGGWKRTHAARKKENPPGNSTPWWRTKVDIRKAVYKESLARERR